MSHRYPLRFALLLAFSCFPLLASSSTCPDSCLNILNVSYPFGAMYGCGHPGFLLDCSTSKSKSVAQWTPQRNLSSLQQDEMPYGVDHIDNDGVSGVVSLTWTGYSGNNCTAFNISLDSVTNGSIFAGTSLSAFNATANLTYSDEDTFLLFNCADEVSTATNYPNCSKFRTACNNTLQVNYSSMALTNCIQFQPKNHTDMEKELKEVLQHCQYYRSLVTSSESLQLGVDVNWTLQASVISQCDACERSKGSCGYAIDFSFLCFCDNGKRQTSTDCSECSAVSCSTGKLVAVIAVPAAFVGALIVVVACFVRRRRQVIARSISGASSHLYVTERGKSFAAQFGSVHAREFSFKELEHATQSFSDDRMVGDGGFGAVYQGRLYDNRQVAVKRLYHDNFRRMEQFYNEIRLLSSLRHSNLVQLYGYCCEDERDLLLVFEYVANGTVADHVHNRNAEPLPWKIRLKIALETAEALSHLHNDISPPIYHRDVKSTNILLEKDFRVKLADFGLSRLVPLQATHVSTLPQGTPGYLDPDYHQSYQLTDKSDVYSYGVVLVELISGLPAVDMSRSRGQINLSSLAVSKIVCGAWQELVDPRLNIDREPQVEDMVRNVAELAFRCLNAEKDDRPAMKEVVKELAAIWESGYGGLKSPFGGNIPFNSKGPFDTKESSRLLNDKIASSPNSLSSNTSWDSSSHLLSSRGSIP